MGSAMVEHEAADDVKMVAPGLFLLFFSGIIRELAKQGTAGQGNAPCRGWVVDSPQVRKHCSSAMILPSTQTVAARLALFFCQSRAGDSSKGSPSTFARLRANSELRSGASPEQKVPIHVVVGAHLRVAACDGPPESSLGSSSASRQPTTCLTAAY